ncbi:MAG TPA: ribosome small subunit-dependent GTPase A [Actinomycetota bacterium]|nr:ribosome small subunit-dependent GTPase A [Actinomycetota bacterium]
MNDPYFPLLSLGWSDRWAALLAEVPPVPESPVPGRVVRRERGVALVATAAATVPVEVSGLPEEIVTGDWVALAGGRIASLLPRAGLLRRRGPDGSEQLLAANLDLVLLVCGLDRPVKQGRISRGAVQAWDSGASPVVVLNKADLVEDPMATAEAVAATALGVDVLSVSSRTGAGLDAVRDAIAGRTSVLLGESGAGKSSLLNALAGRTVSEEGEVRRGDAKGRHTTTRRELHVLRGGSTVIDTPGIRSLGLAASTEAVESVFADVEEISALCRFADCSHGSEPGCAVRQAVEEGRVRSDRLEAFLELRREVESQELRANPHKLRRMERSFARFTDEGQRAKQGRLRR